MIAAPKTPNHPFGPEAKLPTHSNSEAMLINAAAAALLAFKPNAARTVTAGEDPAEFEGLAKAITEFYQPRDIIEQLYVTDIINAQWELQRMRRLVPAAFGAGRPFAVSELQGYSEDGYSESPFPSNQYQEALAGLLKKGLTYDNIDAHVLLRHAAAFESFDKRAAALEVRRDNALEKLEERRASLKTISSSAHLEGCS